RNAGNWKIPFTTRPNCERSAAHPVPPHALVRRSWASVPAACGGLKSPSTTPTIAFVASSTIAPPAAFVGRTLSLGPVPRITPSRAYIVTSQPPVAHFVGSPSAGYSGRSIGLSRCTRTPVATAVPAIVADECCPFGPAYGARTVHALILSTHDGAVRTVS